MLKREKSMAHAFLKRNKSQIIMTTAIGLLDHKIAVSTILLHPQMSVNLGNEAE